MPQHDYDIVNATGASVRADLNSALVALAGVNAGVSAPLVTYANQIWYKSDIRYVYQRNASNTDWILLTALPDPDNVYRPWVSTNNVMLGRQSAGAGVAEEIPTGALGRSIMACTNAWEVVSYLNLDRYGDSHSIDRNVVTVVNTTITTMIMSLSVPAGKFWSWPFYNDLRIDIIGDFKNNYGSDQTIYTSLYWDESAVCEIAIPAKNSGNSAYTGLWKMQVEIPYVAAGGYCNWGVECSYSDTLIGGNITAAGSQTQMSMRAIGGYPYPNAVSVANSSHYISLRAYLPVASPNFQIRKLFNFAERI